MNPKTYYDIKSTYSLSYEKQFKNNLAFTSIVVSIKTRGHARFARSPLVIRLGDSRIRLGNFSEIHLYCTDTDTQQVGTMSQKNFLVVF